jgi:dihydrofolate reductase
VVDALSQFDTIGAIVSLRNGRVELRKLNVSTFAWQNSSLVKGDVAQEVRKLKEQPGQDLLMYASAGLMRSLMPDGLIDEFRLRIHPVVLGSGGRLSARHDDCASSN